MPSYAARNRSLLYALSDFWTQLFADSDTVASAYQGVEVLIGQVYLDLLGDMLNLSVRDTALFRKELFRLLRVREDTILRAPDGRFRVPLGADVVSMPVLHNKVFAVTGALEAGTDYVQIDGDGVEGSGSTGLFRFDPTAAHPAALFGSGSSAMRITGAIAGAPLRIELVDDGTAPPAMVLAFDSQEGPSLTVNYDGPANGGTGTSATLIDAMATHPIMRERVRAELLSTTGLVTAPEATAGFVPLSFAYAAPIRDFGARVFPATFGSKFSDSGIAAWGAVLGVQKGDILRLEPSARSGAPVEVPLALVRDRAVFSHFAAAPVGTEQDALVRRDYNILRSPADAMVEQEPWVIDTTIVRAHGDVDSITSTLYVPGLPDAQAWFLLTDVVQLAGAYNAGPVLLTEWDPGTERFTFFGAALAPELGVPILRSAELLRSESTGGSYTLTPVTGEPGVYELGGITASLEDVGGVAWLTDDLTIPGIRARVAAYVDASTLRIDQLQALAPVGPLLGVAIVTPVGASNPTTALDRDTPAYAPGDAPELRTQLLEGSLFVRGRRLLDGHALVSGSDWVYDTEAHGVRWLSVPDLRSGVSFDYEVRQVVYTSRDAQTVLGFPAALSQVSPTDARVMLYDFTNADITHPWHVGDRIELDAGAGGVNTGTYYVDEILSGGRVVLGGGHTPVLPEPMDGSLGVTTWSTGTLDVEAPQERVVELAMWAPDIQVDRLSLAATYGYLLDRVEPSSESYRSTLRGLMQLYMLGPTVARLEAAVHVLAGFPVVRDENELVLGYDRGVIASGGGLVLDGVTRTARLLSGTFPAFPTGGRLIVTEGFNEGRVFDVETTISSSAFVLLEEPYTDLGGGIGVSWEIVADDVHTLITDRNRYELPITAPFRPELTDPSSFGTLRLPAFTTFTAAVEVLDEVGTPGWWQTARIPAVLWPGQSAQRLQSSPNYIEHVIDPVDEVLIGDPGYRVGTDDLGTDVPSTVIHAETVDGTAFLLMDSHAPFSYENAMFSSMAFPTSLDHVGYEIHTTLPNGDALELQILDIVNATTWRVGLPMTLPGGSAVTPAWKLVINPEILRHNTAFVVFDRYLKQHVFTVQIDATLLGRVDATLLSEIQARLRESRPSHTYMLLNPTSTFTDVLGLSEDDIRRQRTLLPGGEAGEAMVASPNVLRIGEAWRIGDFFRYTDWTRTDLLTGPIPYIAQSPPGYVTDVNNIVWTAGTTMGGKQVPLEYDFGEWMLFTPWFSGTATISAADASGGAWLTFDAPLNLPELGGQAVLAGVNITTGAQQGYYRIGRVSIPDNAVRIYAPGAVLESGITVRIERNMFFTATVSRRPDGSTILTAPSGAINPSVHYRRSDSYRIEPLVSIGLDGTGVETGLVDPAAPWCLIDRIDATTWEIGYVDNRYYTGVGWACAAVDGGTKLVLPPDSPSECRFTPDMGHVNRVAMDPSTAGARRVGVEIAFSGSSMDNVNQYRLAEITEVLSPFEALITSINPAQPIVDQASSPIRFWYTHAATLPAAPVQVPVRFFGHDQKYSMRGPLRDFGINIPGWTDAECTIQNLWSGLTDTPSIAFHAYGRQSPVDLDATPPSPADGDTYFSIGGLSPSLPGARRRSARDFDLTELPLEITRTTLES